MQAIGETFDGEKSLPYLFDTIVRLYRDEKGRFMGQCLKDRANKLPSDAFECSYALFEERFGKETLERQAQPVALATEEQKQQIREYIVRFDMPPEKVSQRLASYGADDLDELTEDNARAILHKLQTAFANRGEAHSSKEK